MNPQAVRAQLMLRGLSYRAWARARKYEPRMVVYAVNTYAGGDRLPRGRLTFRILRDLSKTIGKDIVPGVTKEVA